MSLTVVMVGGPRDGRTWQVPGFQIPNITRIEAVMGDLAEKMTIGDIAEIKEAANGGNPGIVIDPKSIGYAVYEYAEHDPATDRHLYRWTGKYVPKGS